MEEINSLLDIPLVLHGASGIPDDDIKKCVRLGITKCNFATELRIAYAKAIKQKLTESNDCIDPREFLSYAKNEVKKICEAKIKLLGSNNRV